MSVTQSSIFVVVLILGSATASLADVSGPVEGEWLISGNTYRYRVTSYIGNISSLSIRFSPASGGSFQADFNENLFDADGLLVGQKDSFFLFSPLTLTSPGRSQFKSTSRLQADFTSFPLFASREVAQLVLQGTPLVPIASNAAGGAANGGEAVVEQIAGDPNSRKLFPISPVGINFPPNIAPLMEDVTIGMNHADLLNLQLLASDSRTPTEALIWSNLIVNGPGKGTAFPAAADPSLNADGRFSWNPEGWRSGQYTFQAKVADAGGSDVTGLALTVNLTVPEPATVSLLGLAFVGYFGVARRRIR